MKDFDVHQKAYDLIETLENRFHEKEGKMRGWHIRLFDINEVHIVENYLNEAYEAGKDLFL